MYEEDRAFERAMWPIGIAAIIFMIMFAVADIKGQELQDLPILKKDLFGEDSDITIYDEDVPVDGDSIYYVLDISGSMSWGTSTYIGMDGSQVSGNRLDRAKVELMRSIQALTNHFEFNVIAFDCSTRILWQNMEKATPPNKSAASSWAMNLAATGATGTGPAAALALNDKDNKTVVLLTDGGPNCGASGHTGHRNMIKNANTQGAIVHVFGIQPMGAMISFCQGVASDNNGIYTEIQ